MSPLATTPRDVAHMFSADVKAPLILPPMAFASGPDLTAAVSKAGGFGFLPAGMQSSSLNA